MTPKEKMDRERKAENVARTLLEKQGLYFPVSQTGPSPSMHLSFKQMTRQAPPLLQRQPTQGPDGALPHVPDAWFDQDRVKKTGCRDWRDTVDRVREGVTTRPPPRGRTPGGAFTAAVAWKPVASSPLPLNVIEEVLHVANGEKEWHCHGKKEKTWHLAIGDEEGAPASPVESRLASILEPHWGEIRRILWEAARVIAPPPPTTFLQPR
jgi:hypothetical protein